MKTITEYLVKKHQTSVNNLDNLKDWCIIVAISKTEYQLYETIDSPKEIGMDWEGKEWPTKVHDKIMESLIKAMYKEVNGEECTKPVLLIYKDLLLKRAERLNIKILDYRV